jgi:hypothetical protein
VPIDHPPACNEVEPPLTPDGLRVTDMNGPWHVAFMRKRYVKAYAMDLLKISRINGGGVGFLLPMETYTVRHAGCRTRRTYHVPLFEGLLFVCVMDQTIDLDPRRLVSSTLRPPHSAQKRLRDDLERVEIAAMTDASKLNPFPFAVEGANVEVVNGPLRGKRGIVVHADSGKRKFIIQIEILGQAVSYELEDDIDLEPVTE